MTPVEPEPTPKRKRKTKAQRDAEREAQASSAKPTDPMVWIILGGLILFLALWTALDPQGLADAAQPADQSIVQYVPLLLIHLFGRTPAIVLLTVLGGVPLAWGMIGWLRKRLGMVK